MKLPACLALMLCLSGCAVVNLAVNRPFCHPAQDAPPYPACQTTPPAHVWESFDGTRLPYTEALPTSLRKPKAVVILVPGWDAVTGDYQPITDQLVKHGYAVYGSELRYQTYDPVLLRHGWVSDWHAWVRDLQYFTEKVRREQPGLPVYYHGQSMGCLIALEAVAGKPVDGLILQSPAIAMMHDEESVPMKSSRVLFVWARPPHLLAMHLMRKNLTGDPAWDCAWMSSPDRVHAGYTVEYFNQACRMGHEALQTSRHLGHLPVLALEGGKDQAATVFQPLGRLRQYILEDLHAGDPGSPVQRRFYPEGHHLMTAGEVKWEKGCLVKEAVLRDMVAWLDGQGRGREDVVKN